MSTAKLEGEAGDAVAEIWRKALWILEALPPRRAPDGVGGVLRQRKLAANLRDVVGSRDAPRKAIEETITGDIPFVLLLMWWAGERGVDHPALNELVRLQWSAGAKLTELAGTRAAAHAALVSFARRRTEEPDDAFSEVRIRAQIVADLQTKGTALDVDYGLARK